MCGIFFEAGTDLLKLNDDLIHRQALAGSSRYLLHLAVLLGLEDVFHLHGFDDR